MRRIILSVLLLTACGTTTPDVTPLLIRVQYTPAAQPWLAELYDCAAGISPMVISAEPRAASFLDLQAADLILRLGVPPELTTPAFVLGEQEITVIVHPQNPVARLSVADLRALFGGQIRNWRELGGTDAALQVWVYAAGEDVQQIFAAVAMGGQPITSLARQAAVLEEMREAVSSDPAAIGILPKRWLIPAVRTVRLPDDLTAALQVPVLAITAAEPQGELRELLICLQR